MPVFRITPMVVLSVAVLAGCADGVSTMAAETCRSLGFRPGTGIYGDCVDQKTATIRAANRDDAATMTVRPASR